MGAMTLFTGCEEEDDYIAQQLRNCDWQINRTDIARQESGEAEAVSVVSGVFAEVIQNK